MVVGITRQMRMHGVSYDRGLKWSLAENPHRFNLSTWVPESHPKPGVIRSMHEACTSLALRSRQRDKGACQEGRKVHGQWLPVMVQALHAKL